MTVAVPPTVNRKRTTSPRFEVALSPYNQKGDETATARPFASSSSSAGALRFRVGRQMWLKGALDGAAKLLVVGGIGPPMPATSATALRQPDRQPRRRPDLGAWRAHGVGRSLAQRLIADGCSRQPFRLIGAHRMQHSGGESLRE